MELGEAVTLAGSSVTAMVITPFFGAPMAGTEVEGRRTVLYVAREDFDDSGAVLGSAVTARSLAYTVGRIERYDAPLVRLELVR